MTRLLTVARIQLVNKFAVLGMPLLVLAAVFLINMASYTVLSSPSAQGEVISGALMSIYCVMLAVHLQTITQVFPFAAGLSVTRRTFYGATALVVVGQSIGYGVLLYLLSLLERATSGWGLRLRFFTLPFLPQDSAPAQLLTYTAPFLLLAFLGVWVGIVFKRWGQPGVYTLVFGIGLLAGTLAVVASWQGWWPSIGRFFVEQPPTALLGGYPLALAVVIAATGYLTLRRAVP
ncbi:MULTISPECIES: hypothetical protein [Actinopolyspora]|uniref:ABC-2 type transport system permease protein n=1 Tax=Actinopolyspora saharensis TaxID=995062 RepID=A0A1H0ZAZ4_9ACTN|nr:MULTISPECIES: hypothetical protein [Actinopolyspora]NHD15889.1 hypothetical protein [Actinopolyspora sp. BKK2]NHE74897.1 hypothetical protein [Actinopolyspora sp. BKK1]SDQ24603.1 hypothetical protein SAMN04489718_0943 [Actinopolyspora saharensis]